MDIGTLVTQRIAQIAEGIRNAREPLAQEGIMLLTGVGSREDMDLTVSFDLPFEDDVRVKFDVPVRVQLQTWDGRNARRGGLQRQVERD